MIKKIAVDTHTHSVVSGHALSTLIENCACAKAAGMKSIVLTEHGPHIQGGPPRFISVTFAALPHEICGTNVIYGLELDIMSFDGDLGLKEGYLDALEFAIASLHSASFKPGTKEQNTAALIGALANKHVDVAGHPGNPSYPVEIEPVVLAAKKYNKLIEINNHSFVYRKGSAANCTEFARLCKKHGVRVAVSSDAHVATMVGQVSQALACLEGVDFPEELIINATDERFEAYLQERKRRLA